MIASHINLASLTAQAPPSILEPLAPSFRTTTTTTTAATTTVKLATTTTTRQTAIPIGTSTAGIHYGSNVINTELEQLWHNLTAIATAQTITTLRTFVIGINGTLINLHGNGTATAMTISTSDTDTDTATATATANAITTINPDDIEYRGPRYSLTSMIVIGVIAGILSLLTVVGNVLVMISFKIDKQLQTISNYFLFSLAIADFAIGLISMPLFAVSTIVGYWPLGPHICDTWLALDYLASNASVLNLLIISFDRYFSVTRPLTYRAKRTTKGAAAMIAAAWGISLILWPPWIYSWPYIEGKRTVPQDECYIQFIETNQYITFLTALAAFYTPVTIMCFLYYRIWKETKKRQKDLPNLQAGKKDSSKRSNSSDENTVINHTGILSVTPMSTTTGLHDHHESWRRPRSESSADAESVYTTNMVLDPSYIGLHSTKSSMKSMKPLRKAYPCLSSIKNWCIAWWHSGREDSDSDFHYEQEEPSDFGCPSNNMPRDNYSLEGSVNGIRPPNVLLPDISPTPYRPPLTPGSHIQGTRVSRSFNSNDKIMTRSISQESVYTILIRLPPDGTTTSNGVEMVPSIKMIHEDITLLPSSILTRKPLLPSRESEYSLPPPISRHNITTATSIVTTTVTATTTVTITATGTGTGTGTGTATTTTMPTGGIVGTVGTNRGGDIRIPLNAKIIPKEMGSGKMTQMSVTKNIVKKKKKSQEKRQESKAAKTLSAILLSFIITWTPYNILVLIKPLTTCSDCIPSELWEFFYALCYINSTINPVCYALCNATFRRTYIRILTCKWHTRNREGMTRGVYN